jgi:hypothetical protein
MWPITTLAARSRSDIAVTAACAGAGSGVGKGRGSAEAVDDGDADADRCTAGPEAHDVQTAASATIAASRAKRGAEVTRQAYARAAQRVLGTTP